MEFFALSGLASLGILFWAAFVIGFIVLTVSVEKEQFKIIFFELLVVAALLCWLAKFNPLPWIIAHPGTILSGVAIYFVGGILYSVIKLRFFMKGVFYKLKDFRERYAITGKMTTHQTEDFYSSIRMYNQKTVPMQVSKEKHRILFWMTYWPFSLPWTLINEPVRRFFNAVYYRMAGWLQRMSNRMFASVE